MIARTALLPLLAGLAAAQQPEFTTIPGRDGPPLRCAIQLPPGHDPARCHPMVLVLPTAAPDEAAIRRCLDGRLAGFTAAGWVVVAPLPGERTDGLPELFAHLRTRHRIEHGGIHLLGCDGGGERALALAAMQAFEFRSVTVLGAAPLPATAPLRRLRGKPVHVHCGNRDAATLAAARTTVAALTSAGSAATLHEVDADSAVPDLERAALLATLRQRHATGTPTGVAATVAAVLDEFHDAAARGDEATYFRILPDDAVFLGTDASERWTGVQFREFALPWFRRDSAWIYVPQERHVTVAADGAFAWFDERLGSQAYGECRGTGVLARRGEQWCILQYDLTIPVPNDLAGDVVARIRAFTDGTPPATTTVIVVRHAEKAPAGDDPDLLPAGHARARDLAHVLAALPVAAVFHSQYRRTAATVAPLAEQRPIPFHALAADATRELARRIRADHRGQVVVVVGHSNTVPAILRDLGVREPVTLSDDDYDRLFVVTLADHDVRLLPLRYGAATTPR